MRTRKRKPQIGRLQVEIILWKFAELTKVFMDIKKTSESLIPVLKEARDLSRTPSQHIKLDGLRLQFFAYTKSVVYPLKACLYCIDVGGYIRDCHICDEIYKCDKSYTKMLTAGYIVGSYKELECAQNSLYCTIAWILRAHDHIKLSISHDFTNLPDFQTVEERNRNAAYLISLKDADTKMNELIELLSQMTHKFV